MQLPQLNYEYENFQNVGVKKCVHYLIYYYNTYYFIIYLFKKEKQQG